MLDFEARYAVEGYGGIAFYLTRYFEEEKCHEISLGFDEEGFEDFEYVWDSVFDYERVIAVMVGDDREHIVDVSDLRKLDDEDYCSGCGQIGCGHG